MPAHIKGYQYLREAILIAVADMDVINAVTKVLYPEVAKRFNLSLIHIWSRHGFSAEGMAIMSVWTAPRAVHDMIFENRG